MGCHLLYRGFFLNHFLPPGRLYHKNGRDPSIVSVAYEGFCRLVLNL